MPLFVREALGAEITQHFISDPVRYFGPDIDHLVVTLAVRDQPIFVLLLNLAHILVRLLEQLPFAGRDRHILDRNRYPRPGRIMKSDILKLIGEDDGGLIPREPIA